MTGWFRWAMGVAAAVPALLGLSAAIGWHLGSPILVQLHPVFPPLWYSAAAALVCVGAALAALALSRPAAARALGGGVVCLALGALVLPALGLGTGLDALFFRPSATFLVNQPGTPSPGAALAFGLVGIALALLGRPTIGARVARTIGLLGGVVALLCSMNLAYHVFGLDTHDAFVPRAGMSLHEAVGLTVAGAALVAMALCPRAGLKAGRLWGPAAAGACTLCVTFALWQALTSQEHWRIHRMVQFEAATVQRDLVENTNQQLAPLFEYARKPPAARKLTAEALGKWAGDYIGQHPGCVGIACDAVDGELRWAKGIDGAALEASLFDGPEDRRELLARLRNTTGPVLQRAPRGWNGANRSALLYVPLEGEPCGGLLVVFRVQPFLDTILNPNVAPGYAVVVTDGDHAVFSRFAADRDHLTEWEQVHRVSYLGLDWEVRVWPTSYVMAREPVSLARVALVVGLLMVCLLTLAISLAQTARVRARALESEITERRHAEKALRENEAKYRSLVENLENSVFLKDCGGRYVASNKHFCQAIGRDEAEVRGRTDFDLYPPAEAQRYQNDDREVIAEGKQLEKEEYVLADGRARRLRTIRTPVKDDQGAVVGVLGIVWDVTQQRSLEDHVRQAQKMEAVGQLAGGIAHDFNNLLTAILGNLSLILDGLRPGDPIRSMALAAEKAGTRAASLTAQLLGFARQARPRTQPVQLPAIIDEVTAILGRTIDPRIRIEANKAADAWPILADPGQMTQVLMNLCLNARDSMPDQGLLTLETANVVIDPAFTRHHLDARPGDFVRLRVRDTGCGMPPEVQARIFEPFFTTKEVGKGTGLGLAMVFGIVKSHHGWIDCVSAVGRGTCFDVYLPRLQAEALSAAPAPAAAAQRTGRESILLADDEAMIRNLARTILEGQGYKVLLAADGQEAVDLYRRERDRIDLVILDLTMPKLSGRDAFRQILDINPAARVVFASGYSADQIGDGTQERIHGFVHKPYRPAELAQAARAALDRPRPVAAGAEMARSG